MCIGVPMRVISSDPYSALCEADAELSPTGGEPQRIDTMLVGEVPPGSWVLVFINAARSVITEDEAQVISDALKGVQSVMSGASSIDHLFADLTDTPPPPRKPILEQE